MASSNNSKTEKKKTKNAETSKKKKEKDNKEEKKKKKLNLSNGNSKHRDKASIVPCSSTEFQQQEQEQELEEEQEVNTVVANGRTSGTKTKKPKRKQEEREEEEDEDDAKTHAFPMNRIRMMIKGEDPDLRVSQEAILAINKAAEKFLEQFTQDAYASCVQERKKSLSYKHLAHVVNKQRRYDFLSDFVPEKVKAEDALRERNSGRNGGG